MTAEALRRAAAALDAMAAKFEGQNTDPNADTLRVYWCLGRGAVKVGWGFAGDMDRCTARLGRYVDNPKGLCAQYHHDVLGSWPKESTQAAKPDLPDDWDYDAELPEDALPTEDGTDE